jgi:hypothetical protein
MGRIELARAQADRLVTQLITHKTQPGVMSLRLPARLSSHRDLPPTPARPP